MYSYIKICIFIFAFGNAYSVEISKENSADQYVIKVNDFFDEHLSDIKPLIKQFKFDPMPLPNITDDVSVVHINLNNGLMYGASNLTRSGDVLMTLYKKLWRLEARFHIDELRCEFNYTASTAWGWYTEEGVLNVTVKNVTVDVSADYSVPAISLTNPKIHIKHYGLILVHLGTAPSITGAFKGLFVNLALPYFQEHITKIAESTALQVANVTVKIVNEIIKNSVNNIDQFLASFFGRLSYTPVGNTRHQDINNVLKPYINNSIIIDPKNNPFRELDKWLVSTWNKTALIWNNTSGSQATSFGPKPTVPGNRPTHQQNLYPTGTTVNLDKWLASLLTTKYYGPKPTVSGKKPTGQQNNYPTGTTSNLSERIDKWIASLASVKPYSPTLKPIVDGKKPTYNDFLSNFNKNVHDNWKKNFGNKNPADVLADILEQASKPLPKNKNTSGNKNVFDKLADALEQASKQIPSNKQSKWGR